jgi:hypothetical protein
MSGVLRHRRWAALLAAVVAVATLLTGTNAGAAAAAPRNKVVLKNEFGKAKSHVEGTFGKNGTVTGTFRPKRFKTNGSGDLVAVGRLTATLVRGNGKVVGTDHKKIAIPVARANGAPVGRMAAQRAPSCDVLHLVLGPLHLDLLGLQVDLNRVVLNIIAVTGAGNLLGNLLCAITGLLDQGGLLPEVSQLLNSVLAILRL